MKKERWNQNEKRASRIRSQREKAEREERREGHIRALGKGVLEPGRRKLWGRRIRFQPIRRGEEEGKCSENGWPGKGERFDKKRSSNQSEEGDLIIVLPETGRATAGRRER